MPLSRYLGAIRYTTLIVLAGGGLQASASAIYRPTNDAEIVGPCHAGGTRRPARRTPWLALGNRRAHGVRRPRGGRLFSDMPGISDLLDPRIVDNNGNPADGIGQDGGGVDGFKSLNVLAFAIQIPLGSRAN